MSERRTMEPLAGRVELSLPPDSRYMRLARLMASGVATTSGLPLEEVEDFRIAVDELCATLIELGDGEAVRLSFELGPDTLMVVGTTRTSAGEKIDEERLSLSRQILDVVTDGHELTQDGDHVSFRARSRAVPGWRGRLSSGHGDAARRCRAFVNVDMEQYSYKDVTLRVFRDILSEDEFRDWPDVGIALQAYLHNCEADLETLALGRGPRRNRVGAAGQGRLLRTARRPWPASRAGRCRSGSTSPRPTPATSACTAFLLRHHHLLRPALGSHNIRSVAHGLALADRLGLPQGRLKVQMLYGMAEPVKDALVSLGRRIRVYTPYGQLIPGMGLPCPPAAGEHVRQFLLAGRLHRAPARGAGCS